MGFKNQGQRERGFNVSLVNREADTLGGGRIQARMATGSNDLGLGVVPSGRNTPGCRAEISRGSTNCPDEYLAGLLPFLSLLSSVLIT